MSPEKPGGPVSEKSENSREAGPGSAEENSTSLASGEVWTFEVETLTGDVPADMRPERPASEWWKKERMVPIDGAIAANGKNIKAVAESCLAVAFSVDKTNIVALSHHSVPGGPSSEHFLAVLQPLAEAVPELRGAPCAILVPEPNHPDLVPTSELMENFPGKISAEEKAFNINLSLKKALIQAGFLPVIEIVAGSHRCIEVTPEGAVIVFDGESNEVIEGYLFHQSKAG